MDGRWRKCFRCKRLCCCRKDKLLSCNSFWRKNWQKLNFYDLLTGSITFSTNCFYVKSASINVLNATSFDWRKARALRYYNGLNSWTYYNNYAFPLLEWFPVKASGMSGFFNFTPRITNRLYLVTFMPALCTYIQLYMSDAITEQF